MKHSSIVCTLKKNLVRSWQIKVEQKNKQGNKFMFTLEKKQLWFLILKISACLWINYHSWCFSVEQLSFNCTGLCVRGLPGEKPHLHRLLLSFHGDRAPILQMKLRVGVLSRLQTPGIQRQHHRKSLTLYGPGWFLISLVLNLRFFCRQRTSNRAIFLSMYRPGGACFEWIPTSSNLILAFPYRHYKSVLMQ